MKGFGLGFWFGGVRLVERVAQPFVGLDGFPASAEAGKDIDQYPVQAFVERARGCQRFNEGEGCFLFALLQQLRSEQTRHSGVGFAESLPMF